MAGESKSDRGWTRTITTWLTARGSFVDADHDGVADSIDINHDGRADGVGVDTNGDCVPDALALDLDLRRKLRVARYQRRRRS